MSSTYRHIMTVYDGSSRSIRQRALLQLLMVRSYLLAGAAVVTGAYQEKKVSPKVNPTNITTASPMSG